MKPRVLRCVIAFVIACGFTGVAAADTLDFRANVLDPPPPSFPVTSIFSLPFAVTFTTCAPGELSGGQTADGCFAAQNLTGQSWNNLQFTFANTPALAGQAVGCGDPTNPFSIFLVATCSLSPDGKTYSLSFSNGIINSGDFFFVVEYGAPPSAFGTGIGTVVPEPASLFLMATGLIMFGFLLKRERRRGVFQSWLHR